MVRFQTLGWLLIALLAAAPAGAGDHTPQAAPAGAGDPGCVSGACWAPEGAETPRRTPEDLERWVSRAPGSEEGLWFFPGDAGEPGPATRSADEGADGGRYVILFEPDPARSDQDIYDTEVDGYAEGGTQVGYGRIGGQRYDYTDGHRRYWLGRRHPGYLRHLGRDLRHRGVRGHHQHRRVREVPFQTHGRRKLGVTPWKRRHGIRHHGGAHERVVHDRGGHRRVRSGHGFSGRSAGHGRVGMRRASGRRR